MITIKKADFDRLRRENPDYIQKTGHRWEWNGKVCEAGEYMGFKSILTGDPSAGTCLIFEHIHFEIV